MSAPLLIIAHRGASAERPEHTLASYQLAIEQGADFIEPDLVPTRDGVLVCRHEPLLDETTDVAAHPEFAERRKTANLDGDILTGWFAEDFTLAELKRLRARERIPAIRPGNTAYDGRFEIPTFAQVLALAAAHPSVGVYPETKHPTYFATTGRHWDGAPIAQDISALLVRALADARFTNPDRVYIQSFEVGNLIRLKRDLMPAAGFDLPLIQLFGDTGTGGTPFQAPFDLTLTPADPLVFGTMTEALRALPRYATLATPAGLAWMRTTYATGIGPWKNSLLAPVTSLGHDARAAGLAVHPYTVRPEPAFLLNGFTLAQEIAALREAGATGIFTDAPGPTRAALP